MQTDHATKLAAALAPFAVYGRPGSRDVEVGAAIKALDDYYAAPHAHTGHQTRIGSLIEALANTAIGFCISVAFSAIVYPLYGWHPSFATNMQITLWFTLLSIARGYATRRIFTRIKRLHS